jgi:ferredoxin--NADP+ reductase
MQREELPLPVVPPAPAAPRFTVERIRSIVARTPALTSFTITRPADYRFTPGHYGRLGLGDDAAIVWRPYSIASPAADDTRLAFDFTRVPGGAFSELFARAGAGDAIRLDRRSFGFLTVDALAPGGALWLFSPV